MPPSDVADIVASMVMLVPLMILAVLSFVFAITRPMRSAYLNGIIPSEQRATVLSFDSLMGSSGGVVIQPVLGRAADVYSYSTSLVLGALIQLAAAPFLVASRREQAPADTAITLEASTAVPADAAAG